MADIAINPVTRRVQFTGNTGTGPFAFTFNILADADIEVYKNTTLLTLTTDYTVTTNANGTGSITLVAGQALISSDYLTIVGGRDLERTTDFVTGGDLLASSLNEQLDSNVIMSQQLDERFGRSISVSPGDVDVSLELPTASTRANQILSFTSTGAVTATSLDGLPEITLDKLNVDNITLDGNTISTTDTNGNLTLAPNGTGDVIVSGDLIVNGATTTISSTELDITDKNITIASGSADSSAADGAGLTVDGPDATFNYMHDLLGWQLNKPITIGNTTTDYGGALNIYAKPLAGHVQTASIVIYADSLSYDPLIQFNTQSSDVFTMGIDSSDSRMFKIANSSAIGSSPVFTITDNGEISLGTNQPQSGYRFTISGASGAQANIAFKQSTHDNAIVNSSTNQMKFIGDINEDNTDTFSFKWLQRAQEKMILEGGTLKVDTINELTSAAGVTVDGVLLKDGGATVTADVSFGDNDKAIFGAGSDLQIYYDSASGDSIIAESGSGHLKLLGNDIRINNADSSKAYFKATNGGSAIVYYDNAPKLSTTSTGVDITGTLTSDGLTVDGDARFTGTASTLNYPNSLLLDYFSTVTGTRLFSIGPDSSTEGQFEFHTSTTTANKKRLSIATGGDISFYEDTGTTAKFFWDASAERLGIGTTNPSHPLTVQRGSGTAAQFTTTTHGDDIELQLSAENDSGASKSGQIFFDPDTNTIGFKNGGLKTLHTDSSGQVGIGTSSPSTTLEVNGGTGNEPIKVTSTDAGSYIRFADDSTTGSTRLGAVGNEFKIDVDSSEAMRITSSGLVGIGTSSPSALLNLSESKSTAYDSTGISSGTYNQSIVNTNTDANTGAFLALTSNDNGSGTAVIGSIGGTTFKDSQLVFLTRDGSASGDPIAERMRIDSSGRVGIGTSSPSALLTVEDSGPIIEIKDTASSTYTQLANVSGNTYIGGDRASVGGKSIIFRHTGVTEAMRIDSSGNLMVGTTDPLVADGTNGGLVLGGQRDLLHVSRVNAPPVKFSRANNDGDIVVFAKDGSTVGSIGVDNGRLFICSDNGSSGSGIKFTSDDFRPTDEDGAEVDNTKDVGDAAVRFDDIYATNGTIQTSDRNEKQDIAELSDAEQRVAVAAKGLLRKFRWRDAVEEKGDEARTHFGIIAQDLQAAFAAEGLDAGDYAMFIHSTWTDEETGEERSRMGVRYSELLAFIIAAI